MIRNNSEYVSNSLEYVYQPEIGQRVNYTANTGTAIISAANTNLDGTGTTYTVLTAGANGTLIKTITIKAIGNTTRGMVRLYTVGLLSSKQIVAEVEIPAVIATSVDEAFEITLNVDFIVSTDLLASTEKAESFIVTAEGLDIAFP